MATVFRLEGLQAAERQGDDMQIDLKVQLPEGSRLLRFLADRDAVEGTAAALAALAQQNPASATGPQAVAAQIVRRIGVQADAFGAHVILETVTEGNIRQRSAIPLVLAEQIADRLRTEIEKAKSRQVGKA